jgi:hypothetical protein
MADYVTSDRPQAASASALLRRLVRRLLEALHRSRARSAARELRRHRHLIARHHDADKT